MCACVFLVPFFLPFVSRCGFVAVVVVFVELLVACQLFASFLFEVGNVFSFIIVGLHSELKEAEMVIERERYRHTQTNTYTRTHARTHTHTHTRAHAHTHTQTNTYTRKHARTWRVAVVVRASVTTCHRKGSHPCTRAPPEHTTQTAALWC